jgi:hypothetical protein
MAINHGSYQSGETFPINNWLKYRISRTPQPSARYNRLPPVILYHYTPFIYRRVNKKRQPLCTHTQSKSATGWASPATRVGFLFVAALSARGQSKKKNRKAAKSIASIEAVGTETERGKSCMPWCVRLGQTMASGLMKKEWDFLWCGQRTTPLDGTVKVCRGGCCRSVTSCVRAADLLLFGWVVCQADVIPNRGTATSAEDAASCLQRWKTKSLARLPRASHRHPHAITQNHSGPHVLCTKSGTPASQQLDPHACLLLFNEMRASKRAASHFISGFRRKRAAIFWTLFYVSRPHPRHRIALEGVIIHFVSRRWLVFCFSNPKSLIWDVSSWLGPRWLMGIWNLGFYFSEIKSSV